jgi:hypothetical protein
MTYSCIGLGAEKKALMHGNMCCVLSTLQVIEPCRACNAAVSFCGPNAEATLYSPTTEVIVLCRVADESITYSRVLCLGYTFVGIGV